MESVLIALLAIFGYRCFTGFWGKMVYNGRLTDIWEAICQTGALSGLLMNLIFQNDDWLEQSTFTHNQKFIFHRIFSVLIVTEHFFLLKLMSAMKWITLNHLKLFHIESKNTYTMNWYFDRHVVYPRILYLVGKYENYNYLTKHKRVTRETFSYRLDFIFPWMEKVFLWFCLKFMMN